MSTIRSLEPWRQDFVDKGKKLQIASDIRIEAHRKKAEKWDKINDIFGVFTTIVSALTSASLLSQIITLESYVTLLAILVTISSALNTYYKPGERKVKNEIAYKQYSNLSSDIQYYHAIECLKTFSSRKGAEDSLSQSYFILNEKLKKLIMDSLMLTENEISIR